MTVGEVYDPRRVTWEGTTFIKEGSKEQQLVADYRERGLSLTETTMLINRWCIKNGHKTVCRSAVRTCEQKMKSVLTNIEKRPQGKKDINSNWAQCRFRWVAQLLIRLGYHDADPDNVKADAIKLDELKEEGEWPDCFNPYEMEPLNIRAIAWWKDGKYDPVNGTYRNEKVALQVKYAKQVRFSFGVAIRDENGAETGVRLHPFDYTGKKSSPSKMNKRRSTQRSPTPSRSPATPVFGLQGPTRMTSCT